MISFQSVSQEKVQVDLRGATPFTEIYVIDSTFTRIAKLLGKGSLPLPRGTYTFRFQEADRFRDTLLFVEKAQVVRDPLGKSDDGLDSGIYKNMLSGAPEAPLERCWIEDWALAVEGCSAVTVWPCEQEMVDEEPFAQGAFEQPAYEQAAGYPSPASGALDSATLHARVELETETWGRLTLPLIKPPDWLTLLRLGDGLAPESFALNMERKFNAERLAREGYHDPGFDPMELSVQASQALESGRSVISAGALAVLIDNDALLPWHGILALHLQTLSKEPDQQQILRMLRRLSDMFTMEHPDVMAIGWWLALRDGAPGRRAGRVTHMPLLNNSWALLLEAEARFPGEVLAPRLCREVEPNLIKLGAFVLESDRQRERIDLEELGRAILKQASRFLLQQAELASRLLNEDGDIPPTLLAGLDLLLERGVWEGQEPEPSLPALLLLAADDLRAWREHADLEGARLLRAVLDTSAARLAFSKSLGYSLPGLYALIETRLLVPAYAEL